MGRVWLRRVDEPACGDKPKLVKDEDAFGLKWQLINQMP